ncbi:MAG TPA: hypothetical protein PLC07_10205 [Bacillota bacterium]|nr:hypothetical protein [Bacillota bacterium]HPT88067.1 hypothetical protein [Bacillota bacterium]
MLALIPDESQPSAGVLNLFLPVVKFDSKEKLLNRKKAEPSAFEYDETKTEGAYI